MLDAYIKAVLLVPTLVQAYGSAGYQIATGLTSTFYDDLFTAPFTRLVRDGRSVSDGYGISLQELWFVEALAGVSPASSVLVIGNSFGWSTLGLALVNPGAQVVALDAGVDEFSMEGVGLTNTLAGRLGLPVTAVHARSPEDVTPVLRRAGVTSLDLVLIDGLHTHDQLHADWRAVEPFLADRSVVLFHDVLMLQLEDTFVDLAATPGWQATILHATTSGIGVLHRGQPTPAVDLLRTLTIEDTARRVVDADAAEQAGGPGARYWQACVRHHHARHTHPS